MNNTIFLLSKDCMSLESLPVYGNKNFKTPNVDSLAKNGTVFLNHYATAASTSMSMSTMLTGKYPFEFKNRKTYAPVKEEEYESIFSILQKKGYECHLIWDFTWMDMAWQYVREFGDENKTIVHNLDIAQPAGSHKKADVAKKIKKDDVVLEQTYKQIYSVLDSINFEKKQFVWMHLPHILKGRVSYMDDMDVFDNIVGYIRKLVGDENIYLTTDHGHMNMHKGIVGYGFHVYEPIVHIPLITPRIQNRETIDFMTSHLNLMDIILNDRIVQQKYCVVDSTYYAQAHRKTAVIGERFKYIYNKKTNTEELYDLQFDPFENYNILKETYYDKDRSCIVRYEELYYYPCKDEAFEELKKLKDQFNSFYTCGTKKEETIIKIKNGLGKIKKTLKYLK